MLCQRKVKVKMAVSRHGSYALGDTRATMARTKGSYSLKPGLIHTHQNSRKVKVKMA